jgi:biotin-(acetyl-CoA carboxylase) ligase
VTPQTEQLSDSYQRSLKPTSLAAAAGHPFDLTETVSALINHVAQRLSNAGLIEEAGSSSPPGFSDREMIDQFNQCLAWRGQSVRIRQGPEEMQGILNGLDETGRLLLTTLAGQRYITAGELRPVE